MSEENLLQTPTSDERVMAGLSHVAALIPIVGIIAPIVIWVTQKDKSRYVHFQALQALVYQLAIIVGYFIWMGCYMLAIFGTVFTLPFTGSNGGPQPDSPFAFVPALFPILFMCVFFLLGLAVAAYAIVAAVQSFQGRPFRYVLIANWVDRYLSGKAEQPPAAGEQPGKN